MAAATKGRKRVTFAVQAEPGSTVCVAGDFNNWDPSRKKLTDKQGNGMFSGSALVSKGRYEYKLLINDVWCVDPECSNWAHNDFGSLNSVMIVE
jgi:1,4-alpha-glucan branching enzyme